MLLSKLIPEWDRQFIGLWYRKGYRPRDIADRFGTTPTKVLETIRALGIETQSKRKARRKREQLQNLSTTEAEM